MRFLLYFSDNKIKAVSHNREQSFFEIVFNRGGTRGGEWGRVFGGIQLGTPKLKCTQNGGRSEVVEVRGWVGGDGHLASIWECNCKF